MAVVPVVPWSIARIIRGRSAIWLSLSEPTSREAYLPGTHVRNRPAGARGAETRPSVLPVARWDRSKSISATRAPARAASIVMPISMPNTVCKRQHLRERLLLSVPAVRRWGPAARGHNAGESPSGQSRLPTPKPPADALGERRDREVGLASPDSLHKRTQPVPPTRPDLRRTARHGLLCPEPRPPRWEPPRKDDAPPRAGGIVAFAAPPPSASSSTWRAASATAPPLPITRSLAHDPWRPRLRRAASRSIGRPASATHSEAPGNASDKRSEGSPRCARPRCRRQLSRRHPRSWSIGHGGYCPPPLSTSAFSEV